MCRKATNELPQTNKCSICGRKISPNKIFSLCDKCIKADRIKNECIICDSIFTFQEFFNMEHAESNLNLPIIWMKEDSEIICPKCVEFRNTPITFDFTDDGR